VDYNKPIPFICPSETQGSQVGSVDLVVVDGHPPRGYAFNRTVICPLHAAKYNPKRDAEQQQHLDLPDHI